MPDDTEFDAPRYQKADHGVGSSDHFSVSV